MSHKAIGVLFLAGGLLHRVMRSLRSVLRDQRGTLIELPIILVLAGIALAITVPELAKGHWGGAAMKLVGLAAVIAVLGLLLVGFDKLMQFLPAPKTEAGTQESGPVARALGWIWWFLLFGGLGGFATLLCLAFFVAKPELVVVGSAFVGLACGLWGTLWVNRRREAA